MTPVASAPAASAHADVAADFEAAKQRLPLLRGDMSEKQVYETLGLAHYWDRYLPDVDGHNPFTFPGAYYCLSDDQRWYIYIGWKRDAPYNATNKLTLNFVSLIETDHARTYNEVHWSHPESEKAGP